MVHSKCLTAVRDFAKAEAPCGLKWNMSGTDIADYKPSGAAAAAPAADPRAAKAAPAAAGGKGKGKGKGVQTEAQKKHLADLMAQADAEFEAEQEWVKKHGERPKVDRTPKPGQLSPAEQMMAELKARTAGGSAKGQMKKAVKGRATDRKVIDSRAKKKPTAPKPASGGWGQTKTRFPLSEGYQGPNLYRLAYLYGTGGSKEHRRIEIEEPRRDAVSIMECEDINVEVVGVCKNISIEGCKKFNISVDGSIGQLEVSNSESGYLTVNGRIYQLTCDKISGLEAKLCPDAYSAKIITSGCANVNIGLDNPDKSNPDMEYLTLPIPSQYETVLVIEGTTAKLITTPVNHNFG